MIQRHSIILWKKAEKKDKSFEDIAKETYEVLNLLQDYPQELRPTYLTAKTKKDIEEFDWNYENFSSTLKKGVNKEGKIIFEDLGYAISFFSSMNAEDSCAIEIETGNKNEKFYNTLVMRLPLSLNLHDKKSAVMMRDLFGKLVQFYLPYWGCISNKALTRKYGKFLEGSLPTTAYWINYWSEDIVQTIGMDKIRRVVDTNPTISFENGILVINDIALDTDKEEDIEFHNELQKQLFL